MIAEFKFKNFFSIRDEQILSFEPTTDTFEKDEYCYEIKEGVRLLKIATIYGANASGKTNILLALSFFRDLMVVVPKYKTEEIAFTPFLLAELSCNKKLEMSMLFYSCEERYHCSVFFV